MRSNEYEADVPVIGKKDTTALVNRRTWEIRARAVRKLVRKQTHQKPARKPAKAAA